MRNDNLLELEGWVLTKGSTGPFRDRRLFSRQLAYALPFGLAMALAIPQQYAHQYVSSLLASPRGQRAS